MEGGGGVRIAKMLILLITFFESIRVHIQVPPPISALLPLSSCRFHVVASTLSQEGKNMVAMFTKLACLHALLISFLYMSVCSLYFPVYSR